MYSSRRRRRRSLYMTRRYWVHKLHTRITCVMLAVMLFFIIANLIKPDAKTSEKENRNLAQMPSLSASDIADGSFMQDYESYQSDQFVFRDTWMTLKTDLDIITGKSYSNGVYRGKDGYLIEDAAKPDENNLKKNIDAINSLADKHKCKVYTLIVPNAVCVILDKLPAYAPVRSQSEDLSNFRKELSGKVKDIDVYDMLCAQKDAHRLYYHTDHHWTTYAAYCAYVKASSTLGIDANKVKYNLYKVADDFVGTMAHSSGYTGKKDTVEVFLPNNSDVECVVDYVQSQIKKPSVYDTEKLEGSDKYAVFMGGNEPIIDIKTTAKTDKKLMIVKDSYANSFIPFLIPNYSEIVVVDPRYYYDDVYQELKDKDINEVLFLYNANTFFKDSSISGVFND